MARERCPVCGATQIEELLELEDYPYAGNGVVRKDAVDDMPYGTLRITFCHGCGLLFQADALPFDEILAMRRRQPDPLPMQATGMEVFETDHFVQQLRRYAPEKGRVLDIGCGSSGILPRLEKLGGYELVGIDADERAAALCSDQGFKTIHDRFDEGLFEEESFDIVICRSVLEHVEEPEHMLRGIDQILKPGGLFALEAPNIGQVLKRNAFGGFNPHHQTFWTLPTLRFAVTHLGHDILGGYEENYLGLFTRKVEADEEPIDPILSGDTEELYQQVDDFLNRKDAIAEELTEVLHDRFSGKVGVFGAGVPTVDMFFYCDIHDKVAEVMTTDKSRHGSVLGGTDFEVQSMDDLDPNRIEAVILSSERRQDELLERLRPYMDEGGRVLRFTPDIDIT